MRTSFFPSSPSAAFAAGPPLRRRHRSVPAAVALLLISQDEKDLLEILARVSAVIPRGTLRHPLTPPIVSVDRLTPESIGHIATLPVP
jgi:hypothetical protein